MLLSTSCWATQAPFALQWRHALYLKTENWGRNVLRWDVTMDSKVSQGHQVHVQRCYNVLCWRERFGLRFKVAMRADRGMTSERFSDCWNAGWRFCWNQLQHISLDTFGSIQNYRTDHCGNCLFQFARFGFFSLYSQVNMLHRLGGLPRMWFF